MSKNSRETFLEQLNNGSYTSKQKEVYGLLEAAGPMNLRKLRSVSGMAHQTLTSRLSALMDVGLVVQDSDARFSVEPDKDKWQAHANARHDAKYEAWIKKGLENDWHWRYRRQNMKGAI